MSVSSELLCSFELLKPLDSTALKNHIKKGRNKRNSMLSSPVSSPLLISLLAKQKHCCVVQRCREICALNPPLLK
jgi:serine/threonine-protein phosphatase PP1 catalytic subunit